VVWCGSVPLGRPAPAAGFRFVGEQLAPSYNVAPTLTDSERVREPLDSVPEPRLQPYEVSTP